MRSPKPRGSAEPRGVGQVNDEIEIRNTTNNSNAKNDTSSNDIHDNNNNNNHRNNNNNDDNPGQRRDRDQAGNREQGLRRQRHVQADPLEGQHPDTVLYYNILIIL